MDLLKKIGLLCLSIVLLTLAWPPMKFGFLIYIGFVPLLFYVESLSSYTKGKRYALTFLGFFFTLFLFPFISSYNGWGEYNSNVYMVILMCYLPMSLIVSFYSIFKNKKIGYFFLIFSWGSMEILQMNWEFNSPLLMLGYSMSYFPAFIQHYSVWGTLGGALHIIAVNIVLFLLLQKFINKASVKKEIIGLSFLFLPLGLSLIAFYLPSEKGKQAKIALVLAHFEHFTEKYALNPMLLIKKYNALLKGKDLSDREIFVLPESTIVDGGWIENLNKSNIPNPMDSLCATKPVLFGSHMFSIYQKQQDDLPYYVRYDKKSKVNYESHNCIVYRSPAGTYSVRSKEKFVTFHEIIPYYRLMSFSRNWFVKSQNPAFLSIYEKGRDKLFKVNKDLKIYALMCFESFFSNMMVKQKDANVIFVLANESWNNQNKGKEQYFSYMTTKAIESGKTLVKVSNCGYSGVISVKGQVIEKIGYSKNGVYNLNIETSEYHSVYSKIAGGFDVFILLITSILILVNFLSKTEKT